MSVLRKIVDSLVLQLVAATLLGPLCFAVGLLCPKRKFVIGVLETANNIFLLAKILPDSFTVNFLVNPFYKKNTYDFGPYRWIGPLIQPLVFAFLLPRAKSFIYIYDGGFFKNRWIDFILLKMFCKKIITYFCGDDIRSPAAYKAFNESIGYDTFVNYTISPLGYGSIAYENKKKRNADDALRFADLILNYRVDNISAAGKIGTYFPYIIDDRHYRPNESKFDDLRRLRVVHAPSNPVVKGTPLVRAAIKKLQVQGYDFEYIEIINKSNEYVLETLANTHILLNQFYSFVPGLLGLEGMLLQNVVLMSADQEIETFPAGFSDVYIKTRYWEVYDNLKLLLDNPSRLKTMAVEARAFVLANYSIDSARETFHKIFTEKGLPYD